MTTQTILNNWQQSKYQQVIKQLSKLSRDTVLETLVCLADAVTPEQRLALLERIDPDLLEDGAVMDIFNL
jgi:sensor histidine kinase YesM